MIEERPSGISPRVTINYNTLDSKFMITEPLAAEKAAFRARFRAFREALSAEEYATRSAAISARVLALPEVQQAETVHCYWPLVARGEVDTRAVIARWHAAGKRIVLPVVETFERGEAPRLRHVSLERLDALRPNRWGIDEPVDGKCVSVADLEVVVVPALGAGRNGHRLGHGRGYYDAFLHGVAAPKIGLVYAACLVETVPAEPHDVPLTVIVTEDETLRPGADVTSS